MDLGLRDSPSSPGGPPTFTLPKRQETKRIALTDPRDLDQPFAIWSLATLASYLVAEGVVRGHPQRCHHEVMFVDELGASDFAWSQE
jgi:hypothetical protein